MTDSQLYIIEISRTDGSGRAIAKAVVMAPTPRAAVVLVAANDASVHWTIAPPANDAMNATIDAAMRGDGMAGVIGAATRPGHP